MKLVEDANKYYDDRKPWIQFKEDMAAFNDTIFTCATLIANISNIMEPFMPAAAAKTRSIFGFEKATWNFVDAKAGIKLDNIETLFTKFDEKVIIAKIKEEMEKKNKERVNGGK